MLKKVAFLSMDNLTGWGSYDHLLFEPFREKGWQAQMVSWRNKNANWNDFHAVIIRSTWDYQSDPNNFIRTLEDITNSTAHLENNMNIVKWNIRKTYLIELERMGVQIVPSLCDEKLTYEKLKSYFDYFDTDEIIIKPIIGACAQNAFRLQKQNIESNFHLIISTFNNSNYLVQPFIKNIISEGEYSLFFFGELYSHTIIKTPKQNDFRVQEEHGGILKLIRPKQEMIDQANEIRKLINPKPLYSRIDFVRTNENNFALMELELIEPSLYFNMDQNAPARFANVFNSSMTKLGI